MRINVGTVQRGEAIQTMNFAQFRYTEQAEVHYRHFKNDYG